MKFFIFLAILCAASVQVNGNLYNAFGVSKNIDVVLKEFSAAINDILGSIGYIQCYDITEKISVGPINPELVLSNIEILSLKVATPLSADDLAYALAGTKGTISSKSSKLRLDSSISLSWNYKVGGVSVYRGTYTGKLGTSSSSLSFDFINSSSFHSGKFGMAWAITEGKVEGFGSTTFVKDQIETVLKNKLSPVLVEELNRYNDIIVDAMIYNYMFRSMDIPITIEKEDYPKIKNKFVSFYLGQESKKMSFAFNSSIYFPIAHEEIALNGSFAPVESGDKKIALHFGNEAFQGIMEIAAHRTAAKHFIITPEIQEKIFGTRLTIRSFAEFDPIIIQKYETNEPVSFECFLLQEPHKFTQKKKFAFKCDVSLARDSKIVFLKLSKMTFESNLVFKNDGDKNKDLKVGLDDVRLKKVEVESPYIPATKLLSLAVFLQPISNYFGNNLNFNIHLIGDQMKWKFDSIKATSQGDVTLFYDLEQAFLCFTYEVIRQRN